jgi:hypothetical protein
MNLQLTYLKISGLTFAKILNKELLEIRALQGG